MIKLLIVDDSLFMRKMVREMLAGNPEIVIAGEASGGREAMDKIPLLKPDVILLDVIMPTPDGLWTLEEINKQAKIPVIIFSSIATPDAEITSEIFKNGVFDAIHKPVSSADTAAVKNELILKIKAAGSVDKNKLAQVMIDNKARARKTEHLSIPAFKVVAIGSSAGGPPALYEVLHQLPADLGAGVVVAQHMPQNFIQPFAFHIEKIAQMPVKMAQDGDMVLSGRILISPAESTMTLTRLKKGGMVVLEKTPSIPRPSVDVMFASVAEAFSKNTVGVILSGMGSDGTKGLMAIKNAGGKTFSQDEKTSLVYGMPKSAAESGASQRALPLCNIAQEIVDAIKGN